MKTKTTLAEFRSMNSVRKKTHFAKEVPGAGYLCCQP